MMDLIDRQAVIDALVSETCYVDEEEISEVVNGSALKQREWIGGIYDAIQAVKEVAQAKETGVKCLNEREYIVRFTGDALQLMPDVMQELVRCKDCKHWHKDTTDHTCIRTGDLRRGYFFCLDGERRRVMTDDQD